MRNKNMLIKFIAYICLILCVTAIPLVAIYVYATKQPLTYKESYYAALPVKYDRINQVEGEKIVVIGGSSVAFGIDSKLMEKELGMPCVNFGLYAAFGLKPMLDLSRDAIEEGDIVIIAPELSSQMYSDYIGYDFLLQACEGRSDMVFDLGISYAVGLMEKFPSYIEEAKRLRELGGLKVNGVYTSASFDKYGDIVYEREYNIMDGMYSSDNLPEINSQLVSEEFIEMVNEYAEFVEEKGAKVYFGFCPVNELSAVEIKEEDKKSFLKALEEKLDFEIIASLDDHIIDAGYFYDSNFHTNDAGTVLNTVLLINDIKRACMDEMTYTDISISKPPASPMEEEIIASGSKDGYDYVVTSTGVIIVGLDEQGKKQEKLEIPEQIDNYIVKKIDDNAFAGCNATEIIIPSTVKVLSSGIFSDAKQLTKVVLLCDGLPEVGSGLLNGANDKLKIYVLKDWYSTYVTDYFWGVYADYLEEY